ncbi:MAG TPA: helix-turn-helix domain-containing protein [Chitinophagales bacterium]|nr:helix-turn-helix domain-containing protein [Chitinophagales bacterium]HRP39294.1 helix-turn-helix domain-containing protein [Chitinophagales bacterium]
MNYNIILSPINIDELETRLVSRLKTELNLSTPAPTNQQDEFLTVKEVARLLGVSLVTIHQWKKDGKLKFQRFGTRIRFRKSDILNVEKYGRSAK